MVQVEAGQLEWPESVPDQLTQLLSDNHLIGFYEAQAPAVVWQFQKRRMAKLLKFAMGQLPWWRDRLSVARNAADVQWSNIAILDRYDYRASIEASSGVLSLPHSHGRVADNETSGSSGVPLKFRVSELGARMIRAHFWRDHHRQGRDVSKTTATLLPRVKPHKADHVESKPVPVLGLGVNLSRRQHAYSIEDHARWLARVRPAYLVVAPSILDGMLDHYEAGGVEPPQLDQILTLAETVSPELRARCRTILGASIRDRYSCEEVGPIAFQCPHSDDYYHIAVTNTYVEVVDDAGKPRPSGQIGRVIVTNLHNYASPAIRYEIGDLAAMEPACPCGFAHPVLTKLLGRKRFLIRLPSGERQLVRMNAKYWLEIAPFRETRIVQTAEDHLVAELVLDRPITPEERQAVVRLLEEHIGAGINYEVRQVEKIDWGPTYKRQDVVSLI